MRNILYIVVFFMIGSIYAQEKPLFDEATEHYKNEEYDEAVKRYKEILAKDKTSTEVYYNLANAYFKLDDWASSIYFYNKALQLSPNDEDVKNNLLYAEERTIDDIGEEEKSGFSNLIDDLISTFSFNTWAVWAIVFSVLFMVFGVWYYFTQKSGRKRFFFTLSALFLICSVLSVVFAYQQYDMQQSNTFAIVFEEEAGVHNEPNHNSEEVFTLHEGTKVKVLDNFNGYTQIKLTDGNKGWINEDAVKDL